MSGGTNGKGSVAATLASVLSADGRRVGLYTSPHLCSFGERIQIGGEPLPAARLEAHANALRPLITRHELTFFEAATLLGFQAFASEGVEVAVMEVGLGGRLDATNVVNPLVTAVTNVALDHADYLGSDLPTIAAEKAGIAKAGVPLVTAERDPELLEVLARACTERGAPLQRVDPDGIEELEITSDHTAFTLETGAWGRLRLRTPLAGVHQAINTAVAVAMLAELPSRLRPSADALQQGIARGVLAGPQSDRVVRRRVLALRRGAQSCGHGLAHRPARSDRPAAPAGGAARRTRGQGLAADAARALCAHGARVPHCATLRPGGAALGSDRRGGHAAAGARAPLPGSTRSLTSARRSRQRGPRPVGGPWS